MNQARPAWRPGAALVLGLMGLALAAAVVLAAGMGFMAMAPAQVARILAHAVGLAPAPVPDDPVARAVVLDVRLPRILAAVLVGGVLSVGGAVFQGILRNPLADPYTLGISSGAAFGASLAFVLAMQGITPLGGLAQVPLLAFAGAMGALAVVMLLAGGEQDFSSTGLILAGVIVAAILSAAIGFLKFLADEQVGVIIFWLMGNLGGAGYRDLALMAAVTAPCLLVVMAHGRDLNVMAMGRRTAATLGVDTTRARKLLLVTCSLMTAVCVSVAGIIGFVGLIVPHLLRHLLGPDNRLLIPAAFLGGSLLLLGADTLTRAVLPSEVPIGVLTALIGGPVFCVIFKRQGHGGGI